MGDTVPHGTVSGYSWHRCRCDACRAANTAARRATVARRRARAAAGEPMARPGVTGRPRIGPRVLVVLTPDTVAALNARTDALIRAGEPVRGAQSRALRAMIRDGACALRDGARPVVEARPASAARVWVALDDECAAIVGNLVAGLTSPDQPSDSMRSEAIRVLMRASSAYVRI